MKISREQAELNRQAIVAAATRLFRERGYDGVCIAEVMTAAGFTHGGFYNHFPSKEALAAETFRVGYEQQREASRALDGTIADLRKQLHAYVSAEIRDAVDHACPSAAMVADAARQGGSIQEEFARGMAAFVRDYTDALELAEPEGDPVEHRRRAAQLLAQSVGALVLAQAVAKADETLSDELLAAGRSGVDQLLGVDAADETSSRRRATRSAGPSRRRRARG